ncbi:MAG: hypothetical protein AAFP19_10615 [Bacteroidota bacterium]
MRHSSKPLLFRPHSSSFLFLLLFFIVLSSCKKNPDYWLRDYWGEIRATKNGEVWEDGLIYGHLKAEPTHIGSDFNIDVFKNGTRIEDLYLYRIPNIPGYYHFVHSSARDSIEDPGAWYTEILADGDVFGDSYDVLEGDDSYIEVLSRQGDKITAQFQLVMIRDTTWGIGNPSLPDTIRFTDGYIHTKLND